jgi:hypothetical protein
MTNHRVLLDAFAEARRSWDDLVSLQPDVYAAAKFQGFDVAEFARRVNAHQASVDALASAIETESEVDATDPSSSGPGRTGISNRVSAGDEAEERHRHPPVDTGSPLPQDASGRTGEDPLTDHRDRHMSHKAGVRSRAQKEAESRDPDRPMPASRKVAGAFGREPKG